MGQAEHIDLVFVGPVLHPALRAVQSHKPLGKHRNNGWHDLLVGVGGGTTQAGTVALQFDGEGYPVDPTMVALLANESAPVVQTLFE